ncbi:MULTISPECIES: efflux RND transporter periplasmic adaptor subunit [Nitrospirillum]|uniref:HlyD family secretion protein n=1 Tax=Nitrospirillum amazonense TaxID=28077 RepID=A0A560FNN0_9PROT|nr:HlyD family efflux transporter periplasmic adaptor subunit [Nitrospirillum amazonense]MEC4592034.1 HlyD family efflux transporter periplasmic adaptor subunit [Nitrospirillum amazonense]TWB23160.1 HlyD family secretion protein [Nitrospirillum amazonense]
MKLKILFLFAGIGLLLGIVSAYVAAQQLSAQPPVFSPAPNPYANGIYANGIVESRQTHGANIAIFPEVSGPITRVLAAEGSLVKVGDPLVIIDDSVQRETTGQQKAQLEVAVAQIANARASLKSVADTFAKQQRSYTLDPQSVSQDTLDTARNAVAVAETNLRVVERQQVALSRAAAASEALLRKYTIRAPRDGVVLSIQAAAGSYVSSQGAYDGYIQGYLPLVTIGSAPEELEIRCYVDEILINRLPPAEKMVARMYVQGTDINLPLTYERMQPYVSPKIELSNQRQERVDVRVLPIIFRFDKPANLNLYPGQLVDVYIGAK